MSQFEYEDTEIEEQQDFYKQLKEQEISDRIQRIVSMSREYNKRNAIIKLLAVRKNIFEKQYIIEQLTKNSLGHLIPSQEEQKEQEIQIEKDLKIKADLWVEKK